MLWLDQLLDHPQELLAVAPFGGPTVVVHGSPLSDGRPNYTTLETIAETLERRGFELSASAELNWPDRGDPPVGLPFQDELEDLPALAARLETDARLAAEFARYPELANAFPQHIQARATKPL